MKAVGIGDIHGRNNWMMITELVDRVDKVVFIGDYTDSFHVSNVEILHNLKQIIEFKKKHGDKVELLLGNHDLQYISLFGSAFRCSGYRAEMKHDLEYLFRENIDLFKLCYKKDNFIFTHAGITNNWMKFAKNFLQRFDLLDDFSNIDVCLNNILHTSSNWILSTVGEKRGGLRYDYGSPIWADRSEMVGDAIKGFTHIVGHTPIDNITKIEDVYYIDCLGKDDVGLEDFLHIEI